MQYDVATPEQYLAAIDHDWRYDKLNEMRELIHQLDPKLSEGISYKMLSFQDERGIVFHLNAQKNYVGFYVGTLAKVDPTGELLAGLDIGKGCVRIKKSTNIAQTGLREFIQKALQLWQRGGDIDC